MRLRYVFAGVLGLISAGVIVVAARVSLLPDAPVAEAPMTEMAQVYVARAAIPFGAVLTPEMVTTQAWPRSAVPHLAITDASMLFPAASEASGADGAVGRVAKGHFVAGEMLIASKLSAFGADVVAVPPADPGRRAMALRMQGEAAQAGLLNPGDLIDIVLAEGQGEALRALTVLSAVRVLGVGQTGLITVEASPAQSQTLALASQAGVLVAVLHLAGESEGAGAPLDAVSLRALRGEAEPSEAAPNAPAAPMAGVVVRRGGETSIEPVPRSAGQ